MTEAYFNANYTNNPVNLMRVCNVCDSAQPRYKLIPYHATAISTFKYREYQQCLPGCVVVKNSTSKVEITEISNAMKNVTLTNDISCKAYDGENTERQLHSSPTTQDITPKPQKHPGSSDKGKNTYYARAYIRVEGY